MRPRLFKEGRLLLPAWLLTISVPLLPFAVLRPGDAEMLAGMLLLLGCAYLGASSLGPEFSHGTMGALLSQPMARGRIWFEKMLVLGLSLIPPLVFAIALLSWQSSDVLGKGLMLSIPICGAICATPCLTLLTRSTLGAVVFSLAIPFLLFLGGQGLAIYLFRAGALTGHLVAGWPASEETWVACFLLIAFVIYCFGFGWLGYAKFKNFQVTGTFSEEIAFGKVFEAPFSRVMKILFGQRTGAIWSLRQKELRLQQIPFALAAILIVVEACVLGFVRLAHPAESALYFLAPLIVYMGAIPIVSGALSIAEEKSLGVHSWHLVQPVSAFKQWVIKVSVTFGVSFGLGVIFPGVMLWLGQRLWEPGRENQVLPEVLQLWTRPLLCGGQLMLTALAIYASSVAANTLRAAVLATGLAIGGGVLFGIVARLLHEMTDVMVITSDSERMGVMDVTNNFPGTMRLESSVIPMLLVMALFSGLLLLFSYSNFRCLQRSGRQMLAQAFSVLGPLGLGILLAAVLFLTLLY